MAGRRFLRLLTAMAALVVPSLAVAQTAEVPLVAHRAVYDLTLASSTGKGNVVGVRGRILYDFSGSACDGYTLEFRQVSELNNGEGTVTLSDLRSTTWEDGAAKSYRFQSQNFINERLTETVDGTAEREASGVSIKLSKPKAGTLELEPTILFPSEHIAHVITAAREGKTLLEAPIYDGSEKGEKVYNTLTVIGRDIPPGQKDPTDAAAGKVELANMKRWPVTVSYFERGKSGTGEQQPVYSLSFELYENGISRALTLDYNDFAIHGELTSLDIKTASACSQPH